MFERGLQEEGVLFRARVLGGERFVDAGRAREVAGAIERPRAIDAWRRFAGGTE